MLFVELVAYSVLLIRLLIKERSYCPPPPPPPGQTRTYGICGIVQIDRDIVSGQIYYS